MNSTALAAWKADRSDRLNEIESSHRAVGGDGRGRHHQTRELNHATVLLLSAEFQGFCRDLHDEMVSHTAAQISTPLALVVRNALTKSRRLDRANPDESTLADDFRLLGLELWPECSRRSPRTDGQRARLRDLMSWRNVIAHADFTKPALSGRHRINLAEVRRIRSSLNRLVETFDALAYDHLIQLTGAKPW